MVTLFSARPEDFALDIGGIGQSFRKGQEGAQVQQAQQRVLDPATTPEQQDKDLAIIARIDPLFHQGLQTILQRGDKRELKRMNEFARQGLEIATVAKRIRGTNQNLTPEERVSKKSELDKFYLEEARKAEERGDSQIADEMLRTIGLDLDEMGLEAERDIVTATSTKQLTEPREQFELVTVGGETFQRSTLTNEIIPLPPGPKAVETFETIKDDEGNIVGQRNSITGEVKTDPRAVKASQETSLVKNLRSAGIDPNSAEGKQLILQILSKPAVNVNVGQGIKLPPGFKFVNPDKPEQGMEPIPGSPADTVTVQNASKIEGIRIAQQAYIGTEDVPATKDASAKKGFPGARDLIFNDDGSTNFFNLTTAALNTPFTEGRMLNGIMEQGIQAITRGETGATMREEELTNTRRRFMPKVGDSLELVNLKLSLFEDFIGGVLKLVDPSGRFKDKRFDAELELRKNQLGTTGKTISPTPTTASGQLKRELEPGGAFERFEVIGVEP